MSQPRWRSKIPHPCVVLRDGWEAMEHLGAPEWARQCCLVVTDLKMPRLNGFQLLQWMAEQPHLRALPVVVLTSSSDEEDRWQALKLGAREFLVKPSDLRGLVALVKRLHARWIAPHCEEKPRCSSAEHV